MRRVTDERGAVAVIVCFLLALALFGFAAIAIDIGSLTQEKAELQNGADAAALAIAKTCALLPATSTSCSSTGALVTAMTPVAQPYVNGNARDNKSSIANLQLVSAGKVAITTATVDSNDSPNLTYKFAEFLGFTTKQVQAKAFAVWGNPYSLRAIPLTIDVCAWQAATTVGSLYSTTPINLLFHTTGTDNNGNGKNPKQCPTHPSGQDYPGSFGWLSSPSSCSLETTTGDWAVTDTGVNTPSDCKTNNYEPLTSLIGTDIAIPVYDGSNDLTGGNTEYHIAGYGVFHLLGFQLNGNTAFGDVTGCKNNECLHGYFVQKTLAAGTTGGSTNYGLTTVKLTLS